MSTRFCLLTLFALLFGSAQAELLPSKITQVVMLGTGMPIPNPERSGPAVAIVVNNTPYLVDFGPGVVRRAAAASPKYGGSIAGLDVTQLRTAFLTHLHSDHSAGFPDLILTPWTMGRDVPLEVYGPEGINEMAGHLLEAYQEDIRYRLYGLEPANNLGWRVNTHTLEEGLVYSDDNVKVEAFRVKHGAWPNAFGFRFTTPDRVIVISGDTIKSDTVAEYSKGADILIHEVYSTAGLMARDNAAWARYHEHNHTPGADVGELASRAKPKLLVLYHVLLWEATGDQLLQEVRESFDGDVVIANDLDVY